MPSQTRALQRPLKPPNAEPLAQRLQGSSHCRAWRRRAFITARALNCLCWRAGRDGKCAINNGALDAFALADALPSRFEIRRGKVVPQVAARPHNIALPSHQHDVVAAPLGADPGWLPALSFYAQSDDDYFSDLDDDLAGSHLMLASTPMYGRPADEQVSPPSSPDYYAVRDARMAQDVSPVDDSDSDMSPEEMLRGARQPLQPQQPSSNVPAMRHHAHKQVAAPATRSQSRPDERHGLRLSRLGQPQVGGMPWDMDPPGHQSHVPIFGTTVAISSRPANPQPPSLGQRMRLLGRSRPAPLESRPPWKGASGRSRILQPVRDDADAAPLDVPPTRGRQNGRQTSRGAEPPMTGAAPVSSSETPPAGAAAISLHKALPLPSSNQGPAAPSAAHARLSAWLDAGPLSYPGLADPDPDSPLLHSPPSTAAARSTWSPSVPSSPAFDAPRPPTHAVKRKPTPSASARASATAGPPQPPSARPGPLNDALAARDPSPGQLAPEDAWAPPPSRFSVTTYAASNPGTPRQSVGASLPAPEMPSQTASLMERWGLRPAGARVATRDEPVLFEMSSPFTQLDLQKSPAQGSGNGASSPHSQTTVDSTNDGRRSSLMSLRKPLPPAPPELSSNNRISQLNAQIQGLVHRRINITRSIQQMTELMPTDSLFASDEVLRKREAEKLKVEALKEELAEVQREEYDLGLKLHRAYKRQEKDLEFEPSILWVRKVTG